MHDVHIFKSKLQDALAELDSFKALDSENQILVVDTVAEAAEDIVGTHEPID